MSILKKIFNKLLNKKPDQMKLWHEQHIDECLSYFPERKNLKCLVLGCSRGQECEIFYEKGVKNIVGVDLIDEIGKNFVKDTVKYYKISAEDMSIFEDNTFDIVYSFATFEHVNDIERGYKEAARVTKPGGIVHIYASPLWNSPYGQHYEDVFMGHPWVHLLYNKDGLMEYCKKNNLPATPYMFSSIYDSNNFNRLSSKEYVRICSSLNNIEIIQNTLGMENPEMEKQFDMILLDKGYTLEDCMTIWHLFIGRKVV